MKKLVSITGKRDEGQKSKFEGQENKEGKENLKEKNPKTKLWFTHIMKI